MIVDAGIPVEERADREAIAAMQAGPLTTLVRLVHSRNGFYSRKLDDGGVAVGALRFPEDLSRLPLTSKAELVADQEAHPPWGTVLTEPLDRYTRYHQTSSTTGKPLRWVDTNESWQQMLECWKAVYRGAKVGANDRIFFAFSFGPFLGFWTAFEAACQLGAHAIPGGGMSSQQRLAAIDELGATVVCCTPTYALRLAEVAAERSAASPLADGSVQTLIVAGEPGGSIPATRERIERAWGARVIDHYGLTEVGPVGFECREGPGFLHLNENAFVCEVLDPETATAVPDGRPGQLVVTSVCRGASPVIRYETGDIVVRQSAPCRCGRTLARIEGGVLARADDMVTIRGMNLYPAAIEAVVRRFDEVVEFRSTVSSAETMQSLSVEIELAPGTQDQEAVRSRLAQQLRAVLGLTMSVRVVVAGTLPRFEMKARRLVVE